MLIYYVTGFCVLVPDLLFYGCDHFRFRGFCIRFLCCRYEFECVRGIELLTMLWFVCEDLVVWFCLTLWLLLLCSFI